MLAGLKVRQRRISMGIQTFDARMLARMGRSAFGDERTVRKLVTKCKAMWTSPALVDSGAMRPSTSYRLRS